MTDVSPPSNEEVQVTNAATLMVSASSIRRSVMVKNGAVAITLGGKSVTSATNTKTLDPGEAVVFDNFGGPLYGITASGSSYCQIFTW